MTVKDPLWTSAEMAASCGGMGAQPWFADGLQIDSREVLPGDLFVALPGASQNGHDYVAAAFAKGAIAALVSEDVVGPGVPEMRLVHVPDTLAALGMMAQEARRRAPAKIIGVTGSAGKTSTVQALRQALERTDVTHSSVKSFNNHVGVPLSLARMPRESRFGIFELGMNAAGEIAKGAALVRPDVAVVTTIGAAHLAGFKSVKEIARAKAEIFEAVVPKGISVLGTDHDWSTDLVRFAAKAGNDVLTVSVTGEADVRPLRMTEQAGCTCLTADIAGTIVTYKVGQPGREWVLNSLLVLAAIKAVDGDLGHGALALARLQAEPGRGRQHELAFGHAACTLIDDSYNANPLSLTAALRRLSMTPVRAFGRRIALLADMQELGEKSDEIHRSLATDLKKFNVDKVIAFGDGMARAGDAAGLRTLRRTLSKETARELIESLRDGDVLMIKGANSAGLSSLVKDLVAVSAEAAAEDALNDAATGAGGMMLGVGHAI